MSCRPSTRLLSIITPMMRGWPLASCRLMSAADVDLLAKLFAAVRVTHVDHQLRHQAGLFESMRSHAAPIARRSSASPPPRRMMWQSSLPDVEKIAERPCFVTDRKMCGWRADLTASTATCTEPSVLFLNPIGTRQTRRELPMDLAFGRSCADRAPADEVAEVLRRDRVEILRAGRDALVDQRAQQAAGGVQARD